MMPPTHERSAVTDLQFAHRSVRAYTDQPVSSELLETLLRAGQAAPSSSFVQAYSVVRVSDPVRRSRIAQLAGGQPWIEQAPEFLVFCADLHRANSACVGCELPELEGHAEHGLAAIVDVTLMAQNVMLAAESFGLGGVFIGGIRNDLDQLSRLLELPELVVPVFGLCLGWPASNPEVKPRLPLTTILHQEVYREALPQALADYDRILTEYYGQRSDNRKHSNWSRATAGALQGKHRPDILGFLKGQRFFRR